MPGNRWPTGDEAEPLIHRDRTQARIHSEADLRTFLILGAKSAVMSAGKRSDRISQWLAQLKERVGWQKAVEAPANKNARILWAVLTRGETFDPEHVPLAPHERAALQAVPMAA